MSSEIDPSQTCPPVGNNGADGADFILAALNHLRGVQATGGSTLEPAPLARQEKELIQWANRLGFLLKAQDVIPRLSRGGQEHDICYQGDRVLKVTRNGVFGLSPGIELALVSSAGDSRCFHLWEASPLEYLERLHLQNLLVPGLNRLEGVIVQANDEMSIATSQPRFDIVPVTIAEVEAWFAAQGFVKIAESAYYRAEDNLGVFDAHDKNLLRSNDLLIPFDVIPCHPTGGFLAFIEETLSAGHTLRSLRTVTTRPRP